MADPWRIDWYVCRADAVDVAANKAERQRKRTHKPKELKEGDEFWRVPLSIGPVYSDHNHWAGDHLALEQNEAVIVSFAPVLMEYVQTWANAGQPEALSILGQMKRAGYKAPILEGASFGGD